MKMSILTILIVLVLIAAYLATDGSGHFRYSGGKIIVDARYCKSRVAALSDNPVIFVPGLKGSLLYKDGKKVWLAFRHLLPGLGEPLVYSDNDGITTGNLFTNLGKYTFYSGIASMLGCAENGYIFTYDWRQPPERSVRELAGFVERVRSETGLKPHIISHSLGGLITHAYMKTSYGGVGAVVYVSVPFNPGIGYLDDIERGAVHGLNRTVLSPEAVASQPVSYVLLPHAKSKLYKEGDLSDASVWKRDSLGPFARNPDYPTSLLDALLASAHEFHRVLDTPVSIPNRFLIINSDSTKTIRKIDMSGMLVYEPGDGRVLRSATYPVEYESLNAVEANFSARHSRQMNNPEILARIAEFLSE